MFSNFTERMPVILVKVVEDMNLKSRGIMKEMMSSLMSVMFPFTLSDESLNSTSTC